MKIKKEYFIIPLILIFLIVAGIFFKSLYSVEEICIENKKCFEIEIAESLDERQIGLTKYENLSYDSGMLFIFSEEIIVGFWMKDMEFPIDIIWINENFEIVGFEKSVEPCLENCEVYFPKEKIKYVLEINSGLSEEYGFEIGDEVKL